MSFLEYKIPPLIIMLITAAIMWFASPDWSYYVVEPQIKYAFMIISILFGISIDITGLLHFHKSKTTINPLNPEKATKLVNHGIYQYTRNPMYLGMVFILTGWAIFLTNFLSFAFIGLFVLYITQFQIKPEEKILMTLFGDDFSKYKRQVRRWI